jgi:hypothetical protein
MYHLTAKGKRMFSQNEDLIPVHWFALSESQKQILEDLHNNKTSDWDETALILLCDIGLVKLNLRGG